MNVQHFHLSNFPSASPVKDFCEPGRILDKVDGVTVTRAHTQSHMLGNLEMSMPNLMVLDCGRKMASPKVF